MRTKRKSAEAAVSDFWFLHYIDRHCTLCGNSGVIDTTGVRTAAGVPVGRRNYCGCPNGQRKRELKLPLAEQ